MTRHRDLALFTAAAVVVLPLDQLTKARVRSGLPPGGSWPSADTTVGRFFSFTHVQMMARRGKLKMKPIRPVKVIGTV